MGQYYKPVSIDRKQGLRPWDYENGAKLMEHSYIGNHFMSTVMMLLAAGGLWHKTRIVWGGDYSEQKQDELISPKTKAAFAKWYAKEYPENAAKYPENLVPNVYDLVFDEDKKGKIPAWAFKQIKPAESTADDVKHLQFVVNHTKKQFVDLAKCPKDKKSWGWQIHPLSLLTCDSFGGGGSYHGENPFCGKWVGDVISAETTAPADFKEIKPRFKE